MLLLYAIAAGLLVGRLAGGRLDALDRVRFRWWPLALAGLLFQLVLFSGPVAARIGDAGPALYVGSTLVVFVVLLANIRLPGFWLLALGAFLNLVAITTNGGWMPSAPEAWMQLNGVAVVPTEAYTNSALIGPGTAFPALGDIFVLPRPLPLANVFSIGDLLIAAGAVVFLVRQMRTAPAPAAGSVQTVRTPAG
ncbi:MAG: DUF5317 domain-containing protein [Chloroflexota bacterium]